MHAILPKQGLSVGEIFNDTCNGIKEHKRVPGLALSNSYMS